MTPDPRELQRRELRRRLRVKHEPMSYLPEPAYLAPGSKIRVLGGTADALAAWRKSLPQP
jgi:hypothetical protein